MTTSAIIAEETSNALLQPAIQDDQSAEKKGTDKQPAKNQLAKNQSEYRFVFIGNSHSIIGTPFDHLQKMIKARNDKPTVSGQTVAVDFLDALEVHKATWEKPDFAAPGILVLQGQKISMSGRYSYSTQTATDIARIFSEKGTRVLLFAEWGQAGVAGDGVRIQGIYEQIATAANTDRKTNTPVEVAPIGLVWDEALKKFPDQKLHDDDGNHSNELGGFVTAIAFYCWLFDELPPEKSLPRKNHKYLKEVSQIAIEICRQQKAKSSQPSTPTTP